MKNRAFFKVLCLTLAAGLLGSCMGMEESDPSSLSVPKMKTFEVNDNGSLVFELTATVDKSAIGRIASCGFYYGKKKDMSDVERIECKMTGNTFATDLTLREYGGTFYACSYISNGLGSSEICSDPRTISVGDLEDYVSFEDPVVLSYDRETKTAVVSISFNVQKGAEVSRCGLCYGDSQDLSKLDNYSDDTDFADKTINAEVLNVEYGQACYVRPYLYDGDVSVYGSVEDVYVYSAPMVETSDVTDITDMSAVCGGKIVDDGGSEIIEKGVVWSTEPDPTVAHSNKIDDATEGESFISSISGLLYSTKYYVRAYAVNSIGTSYGETREFQTSDLDWSKVTDLSSSGTANCYIVSKSGSYKIPAVKGNSSESVGTVKSVEVLWESFGTSTAPKAGDLIKSVSYSNGTITFQTSDTFKEGNAVIAARGSYDEILWSWHIWMTDEPSACSYRNVDKLLMDRNLGATSATPGDVGALGLLYQWGRKDPFLGSSSISSNVEAKSTITWPSPVSSSSSRGTIAYAVEHPTTFITYNSSNYDWYYTGSSTTDNTRWQSKKTIYDPCPAGWRVPDGGDNGIWAKAGFDDQDYDDSDEGMLFGSGISSPSSWYPASGYRSSSDGDLYNVGNYGVYWSVTPYGYNAYGLTFTSNGGVYPSNSDYRAYGHSVRCLQE